jgi:8-oxo-dGTP pyrophosphatase MutT (NUDIX family)/transcriptional regulator with XRE-family HTH domain
MDVTPSESARRELADLQRSRRGRQQPADVGLPAGERRRAPGLRREEVAALAAISTTYYTFLEQARDVQPSAAVLDGLARALRLGAAERAHLYRLAGVALAAPAAAAETLSEAMVALVDRLDPHPAYVSGRCFDVLAANRGARALFTDWYAQPEPRPNVLRWMFLDPRAREVYVDWEDEAGALLGRLRAAAAEHPGDAAFAALVEELHAGSAEVRAWWPRHDVVPLGGGAKRLRHPVLGELPLSHVVLLLAEHPDQKLVCFTAPAPLEPALRALAEEVPRHGARIVLLDRDGRVLLIRWRLNEDTTPFWFTPGGGLQPGETHVQAARRELHEELGLDREPGPWLWERDSVGRWRDGPVRGLYRYYLVRLDASRPALDPGPELDAAAGFLGLRWWTVDELAATADTLSPSRLPELLAELAAHGPPAEPIPIGR